MDARIVVALVRDQCLDPVAWPTRPAAQRPDPVEQLRQHQVVVDVGARQRDHER